MTTLILREGADRLHVELNRPDVRNAINDDMVDELHAVCTSLEREPRILILTGTSTPERGVFAACADIRQLLERGRDEALAGINSGLFTRIARLPMPVIAAVDGFAIGGGAELAYAADIRIASTRAVFGNPETAIGILAGCRKAEKTGNASGASGVVRSIPNIVLAYSTGPYSSRDAKRASGRFLIPPNRGVSSL